MDKHHVGCLFGSFDPIHTGHLIVAEYMISLVGMAEVQIVVSPQSPHKIGTLNADYPERLEMARLATHDNPAIQVSDVERALPRPSYTIDALRELSRGCPQVRHSLIMGSDNLAGFVSWKSWESILDEFGCHVYARPGFSGQIELQHQNLVFHDAPHISISSTYIRSLYESGKNARYLVPDRVEEYIRTKNLYQLAPNRRINEGQ